MKIIFTNITSFEDLEKPQPASKFIPEWYTSMDSYVVEEKKPDGNAGTTATAKRCMPIFDSITAGYIITSPADVWVSIKDGNQHFEWSAFDLISFHPKRQIPDYPLQNKYGYPKWTNFWSIKTPKGYSTLFVQPFHRQSVFTILPGIVDTDTYTAPVNFPMVINDPKFEGLIPKGTPIAQVIPFKRDNWNMEFGSEKDFENQFQISQKINTVFFDAYKKMFRKDKNYK
jgi:hypothetical protein